MSLEVMTRRKAVARRKSDRLAYLRLRREAAAAGLRLLREHFEANDPYVDDNPTARGDAARHRKGCKDCALHLALLRFRNHNQQMAKVRRSKR